MATTKKPGTSMVLWEQEMKAAASKQSAAEKEWGGGEGFGRIQITGGHMMIDGEYVKDNCLDVVVLASVHLNEYYDKVYDAKNPTVPVCFAYGDETLEDPEAEMNPVDEDVDNVQRCDSDGNSVDNCTDCWANQMGSADVGKGKACKNVRRLLLMTDDGLESAEAMGAAEVRSLGVPVMSVKNWVKYVKMLADDMSRPYFGVVTTVSVVPDPKSQFKLQFAFKELVNFDQDLWTAMKAKTEHCSKEIVQPYPHQAELDDARAAQQATAAPTRGRPGAPAKAVPMKPVGRVAAKAVAKPPVPAAKKSAKY